MHFSKIALAAILLSDSILDTSSVNAGFGFGSCPSFTNQANININNYYGTWYEISHDATFFYEFLTSCTTATYSS